MAGDWLPMRLDLAKDPAVISITAQLDGLVDEEHTVGKLHTLWSWANSQLEDGNAPGVTESWIDRYIGVPGFAKALAGERWLVIGKAGIRFPKWDRWNAQGAKKRLLTTIRVRKHRLTTSEKGNAGSVTKALPQERREEESTGERCGSGLSSRISSGGSGTAPPPDVDEELPQPHRPERTEQIAPGPQSGPRTINPHPEHHPAQKNAAPGELNTLTGILESHQNGNGTSDRAWIRSHSLRIVVALDLPADQAMSQRRAVNACLRRCLRSPVPDELAKDLERIAARVAGDPSADQPVLVWQSEARKALEARGCWNA